MAEIETTDDGAASEFPLSTSGGAECTECAHSGGMKSASPGWSVTTSGRALRNSRCAGLSECVSKGLTREALADVSNLPSSDSFGMSDGG